MKRERPVLGFLLAFAAVFAGLALLQGIGPFYVKAHAALGNALLAHAQFASGVRLYFTEPGPGSSDQAWALTLHLVSGQAGREVLVPIDLRTLVFLPTAAFIALAIAIRLSSVRAHLRLLGLGLLCLEPLLLALVSLPLLSFMGGTGPVHVFSLTRPTLVVLQVLYRALVAPPGMTYAIPLVLWWFLSHRRKALDLEIEVHMGTERLT